MASDLNIRAATTADIPAMTDFILTHGPNDWNYLPAANVRGHLNEITTGIVQAVIAERTKQMLGFITFHSGANLIYEYAKDIAPHHLNKNKPYAYIAEAVVHRETAGQGIGTQLLRAATEILIQQKFTEFYIQRHADNQPSGGMMRKAGFTELATFADPDHRPTSSRQTTLCGLRINSES